MIARDPNGASWYVLRYHEDFTPRTPVPATDPAPPRRDDALFYDESRHVLELVAMRAAKEAEPPPGIAADVDGQIYYVDLDTGVLRVRACDGSSEPLVCEPNILVRPAGLALDRRGLLYIADPPARRVVVLDPETRQVRAILNGGVLVEPVDVAVAPSGMVYVADRGGLDTNGQPRPGKIAMYDAGLQRAGQFVPRDAEGLVAVPRPIAVMIDTDGSVLVADASYPRLLRFDARGEPTGDVVISTLRAAVPAASLAELLAHPYGTRRPRFIAGVCASDCATPALANEGGAALATVHRELRVLLLALAHVYPAQGVFVSAALDSGTPGTTWHRVDFELDVPEGTRVIVETTTSDSLTNTTTGVFDPSLATWDAARGPSGDPIPVTPGIDQLVQSSPGRFLWVRLTLASDGATTPSLSALRVYYPRVSYLDLLPRVYRRDPDSALFLEHFLALFEHVFTDVEQRYEDFSRDLDPLAAPRDVIDWLGAIIDLTFDPSWPLEKRRALVAEAVALYARRGTPDGIARFVEIYTGAAPAIVEWFLARPGRPALVGEHGGVLGCSTKLGTPRKDTTPDQELWSRYAHRFSVYVYGDDCCDDETLLRVVDRIVTINSPAHTYHTLQLVKPDARVGLQSTLGVDFVLGGTTAPATVLPPARSNVLGSTTVLGGQRPEYLRRPLPELQ